MKERGLSALSLFDLPMPGLDLPFGLLGPPGDGPVGSFDFILVVDLQHAAVPAQPLGLLEMPPFDVEPRGAPVGECIAALPAVIRGDRGEIYVIAFRDFRFVFPSLGCRRSEEPTSELQSRPVISYAVFCLTKKKTKNEQYTNITTQLTVDDIQYNNIA